MNNKTFATIAIVLILITAIVTYRLAHNKPQIKVEDSLRNSCNSLYNSFQSVKKSHKLLIESSDKIRNSRIENIKKTDVRIGNVDIIMQKLTKSNGQQFFDSLTTEYYKNEN